MVKVVLGEVVAVVIEPTLLPNTYCLWTTVGDTSWGVWRETVNMSHFAYRLDGVTHLTVGLVFVFRTLAWVLSRSSALRIADFVSSLPFNISWAIWSGVTSGATTATGAAD